MMNMKRDKVRNHEINELRGNRAPDNRVVSRPHQFPTSGFRLVHPFVPFQEEQVPQYTPRSHYFVRIGDIYQKRYQIICKLGFGGYATVWLARDLM